MKTLYHVGVVETVPYDVAKDLATSLNGRYHSAIGAGKLKVANTGFMFVSKPDAQCFERLMWYQRTDIVESYIWIVGGMKCGLLDMDSFYATINCVPLTDGEVIGKASITIRTIGGSMTWNVVVASRFGSQLKIIDIE